MFCKNCGRKVSWNNVRCGQCGCETFIEETSPTEEASITPDSPMIDKAAEPLSTDNNAMSDSTYNNSEEIKEKTIFCKNCGHKVSENSRFCAECGHPLNNQNNVYNSAPPSYNNFPQGIPNGYNQGINYNPVQTYSNFPQQRIPNGYNQGANYSVAPPYNNFPQGNMNNFHPYGVSNNSMNNCIYQTKASRILSFHRTAIRGTIFLYDNELIYEYSGGVVIWWAFLGILPILIFEIISLINKKKLIIHYNEVSKVYNNGSSLWGNRIELLLDNGETYKLYIPSKNCYQFLSILTKKTKNK